MENTRAHQPLKPSHSPPRPLVDSFVVAPSRHLPVSQQPGVHHAPAAPKSVDAMASSHATAPQPTAHPKPRGISNIDGFVPVRRASSSLAPKSTVHSTPTPKAERRAFAAGPLYTKYLPRDDRPADAQPKPANRRVIHPPAGAVPAHHPALQPTPKPFTPAPRMPVHKPGKSVTNDYQPTLDEMQAILAIDDEPTLRRPLGKAEKAKRAARVSVWAIVGMLILAGLSLFSQTVGEAALLAYAIAAIWRRWPSQRTFALALGMFVGIIITSLLSSANWSHADAFNGMSENLAVYAFLLLCIGTVGLAREVRADAHAAIGVAPDGGIPHKRPRAHTKAHASAHARRRA